MDQYPVFLDKFQEDESFQQFFNDLVAEFVQDRSRPYLEKYPQIESYAEILEAQNFIKDLAIVIAEHNLQNAKQLKKLISKSELSKISEEKQLCILQALVENIQIIKKQAIQRMISISTYTLVDFNWNLNVCMASDNFYEVNIPILLVEFIIKRLGEENEVRVCLEFSKEELSSFLVKLKAIQKTIQENDLNQEF